LFYSNKPKKKITTPHLVSQLPMTFTKNCYLNINTTAMSKLLPLLLLLGLIACKDEPENKVQELRGGANADLIRNPISADSPLDTQQMAKITFETTEYNFGTIDEGDVVEYSYKFTNTGKTPLTILSARSSCGCTTPEWPKEPIPPGGNGEIVAKFNSEGRIGEQSKLVIVTANTFPNETTVKLKGVVKE
jgi:hypothetical protein